MTWDGKCKLPRGTIPSTNQYVSCSSRTRPAFYKFVNRASKRDMPTGRSRSPPLLLNHDLLYPFTMTNTLYFEDSFWLLLPVFVTPSEQFVWSYFVQTLLRHVGRHGAFVGGISGFGDFETDKEIVTLAQNNLAHQLTDIGTNTGTTSIAEKALTLLDAFIAKGLLDKSHKENLNDWFDDLLRIGYIGMKTNVQRYDLQCDTRRYVYVPSLDVERPSLYLNRRRLAEDFSNTCPDSLGEIPRRSESITGLRSRFQDVLLIIWFAQTYHIDASIPYTEALYRPVFPNILYCGPSKRTIDPQQPSSELFRNYSISYVEHSRARCDYGCSHMCMAHAIEMGYVGIKDYLIVGDDVMFNFWNVVDLPRHRMWFQGAPTSSGSWGCGRNYDVLTEKTCVSVNCASVSGSVSNIFKSEDGTECLQCNSTDAYSHWNRSSAGLNKFIDYMKNSNETMYQTCHQHSVRKNGGYSVINGRMASDIYFIPAAYVKRFSAWAMEIVKHGIFMEVGVPWFCKCMEDDEPALMLSGHGYFGKHRYKPWLFNAANVRNVYFHPNKLGSVKIAGSKHREYYCNVLLPQMFAEVNHFDREGNYVEYLQLLS